MVQRWSICFILALTLLLCSDALAQRQALELGGLGYASAPDSPSLSISGDAITVEVWLKHDGQSSEDAIILDKQDSDRDGYVLQFMGSGEEVPIEFRSDRYVSADIVSESGIPAGVWTHVAVTYDGNEVALYINGKLDNKEGASGNISDGITPLQIGTNDGANANFYSGQIDEVRIWNLGRTEAQIRENYQNELSGSEEGLTAYFRFDETSGTTAYSSARPMTATLSGDAMFIDNSRGATTDTATDSVAEGLPESFTLKGNYPNPFNPQTTIRYGLSKPAAVTLTVYNMLGQQVDLLVHGQQQAAGWHQVSFDAGSLPSGMYFYRIEAAGFTETRKMVLVK